MTKITSEVLRVLLNPNMLCVKQTSKDVNIYNTV